MSPDPRPDAGSPAPGESTGAGTDRRRVGALDVLRGLFLVAAIGFGWWGLREYRTEIVEALSLTSPARVLVAVVVVFVGVAVTGVVWRGVLAGFGHDVPRLPASAIFFVGQLGKYIPGSVWSLGAQADMARRYRVPSRTTVAVGLVFLWVHVVSALPVALLLGQRGAQPGDQPTLVPGQVSDWITDPPWGVTLAGCLVAVLLLSPAVLGLVGRLLAGREQPLRLGWSQSVALMALMAVTWALYGVGLALVVPPPALESAGGFGAVLGPVTAAFAASYMVGVVIVLAPAGAGVRELTLIALLAPLFGVPSATAAALLMRVVHTIDDFAIAGIAWLAARPARDLPPVPDAGPGESVRRDSGDG